MVKYIKEVEEAENNLRHHILRETIEVWFKLFDPYEVQREVTNMMETQLEEGRDGHRY